MGTDSTKSIDAIKSETLEAADVDLADILFANGEYSRVYDLLGSLDREYDPQVLWRLARCGFMLHSKENNPELLAEARELADLAAALDHTNGDVCKWAAILYDKMPDNDGSKSNINQLNHYVIVAMQLESNLDADSLVLFGESYIRLMDSYQRCRYTTGEVEINLKELKKQAIKMFATANKVGRIPPKIKLQLADWYENDDRMSPLKAVTTYREIISEHGSHDDPAVKEIVGKALARLRVVYNRYFI